MTIDRNENIAVIAKVTGPAVVLLTFLAFYLWYSGRWSGIAALLLVLASPVIGIILGVAISAVTRETAKKLTRVVTADLDLPPEKSFSWQESLAARGELELARDAYENHLKEHPDDLNARLALAALWRDHLGDPEQAIRCYCEARRRKPNPTQEFTIGNALIDLYRATGQPGRELAELARFAERFAGTDAGERAREALRRRKAT